MIVYTYISILFIQLFIPYSTTTATNTTTATTTITVLTIVEHAFIHRDAIILRNDNVNALIFAYI